MKRERTRRLRRLILGVRDLVRDAAKGVRGEKFAPSELSAIEAELEDAFDALQRAKNLLAKFKVKSLNKAIVSGAFKGTDFKQNKGETNND